ncbi:hypothetical protein [Candidatus Nitrososphaera sp. FF02]|uniref:hypothetical protein n=1 Tax=Candidatus Nitrososphaera sp. FF02 TaxID=3398226 RepID=UPI0039EADACC
MGLENARVYTSDEKNVGKVVQVDEEYFTSLKKGLMVNEEYRIPLDAISDISAGDGVPIVRLALSKEQLKHGHEFVKGRPNSGFVSGRTESEPKIPLEKQVIRYEATRPLEGNVSLAPEHEPPPGGRYSCDMCEEKFDDADGLQGHRGRVHKGPVGV